MKLRWQQVTSNAAAVQAYYTHTNRGGRGRVGEWRQNILLQMPVAYGIHCCANDTFITFYRFFTLNVNLRPFIVAERPTAATILFVSNAHRRRKRRLFDPFYRSLPSPVFLSFFSSFFPFKLIYENVRKMLPDLHRPSLSPARLYAANK